MNLLTARTRKLLSVLAVLLLVGAVVPFVVYAVPQTVGADQSYVVLSASMSPGIQPGDAVVVGGVASEAISEGDVITFRRSATSETPVTHRVVGVEGEGADRQFVTKGDANEKADPTPVAADSVIGRVVLTLPYVGYVSSFADTPVGFAALVVVPFGLLVATELRGFLRARRSENDLSGDNPTASTDLSSPTTTETTLIDPLDSTTDTAETAEPTDPTHDRGSTDSVDATDSGLTLTRADLTLSLVLLVALGLYAGYIGVTGEDPLSVTVAAGSLTAALLLLVLRQFGFDAGSTSAANDGGSGPDDSGDSDSDGRLAETHTETTHSDVTALARVSLSPACADLPRIDVSERHELSALAAAVGRPVVTDESDGTLLVVDGDVLYACAPTDTETESVSDTESVASNAAYAETATSDEMSVEVAQ
ncbi:hypothetical protein AUR64_19180 [Haloprofundus marisrubri]|uniref:Peptidase S26 domain-containing protein n=1 Tax=Haloprofundus marisrubri TaxID=1514971 RepID=A0A0W1R4K6_9EURY|nr:signal peptidase I [Haloprofundus marisrubri]KTG08357.1 hypothetical protein AUR64_19180 [Haloprofundus marisrubri]